MVCVCVCLSIISWYWLVLMCYSGICDCISCALCRGSMLSETKSRLLTLLSQELMTDLLVGTLGLFSLNKGDQRCLFMWLWLCVEVCCPTCVWNGAPLRQRCKESSSCQLRLRLDPSGCDSDCSEQLEERRRPFISPPAPISCLWSPPLFSFFCPLLGLFPSEPLCPSGALSPLGCRCRCVSVRTLESRIKLRFIVLVQEIISRANPHTWLSLLLFMTQQCLFLRQLFLWRQQDVSAGTGDHLLLLTVCKVKKTPVAQAMKCWACFNLFIYLCVCLAICVLLLVLFIKFIYIFMIITIINVIFLCIYWLV